MTNPLQLRMGVEAPHRNRYLFSDHYLENILPDDPRWKQAREEADDFLTWLQDLYADERDQLPDYNEDQLEEHWFKPIFERLGHVFETQASVPGLEAHTKRPDYVFFPDDAARQRAASLQNEEDYAAEALAVGEVKRWDTPLGKKRKGGGPSFEDRNPSWQIDYYIRATGLDWGILTNGRLWRLVHEDTSQRLQIYYEVDLVQLLEEADPDGMRYFTLFFRQAAFQPDRRGRIFLDDALAASNAYAVELEEDLEENVYQALERLMQGFLDLPSNNLTSDDLQEIYDNSLYLLYRLLFILYGESRGLLPLDNDQYRRDYSLTRIKNEIAQRTESLNPRTTLYWGDIKNLFHIINGDDAQLNRSMGVPRYDGGLFNPDLHPFLEEKEVGDQALVEAIDLLSRRETEAGREFADYRTLGVRHLGSIYEGLLEYQPRVAEEPMVAVGDEWLAASEAPEGAHVIERRAPGEVYLETDRGERKATGSYYTPQYIVEYIVEHTLGPLVEEATARAKSLAKETGADGGEVLVDEILDLKCLDPAMGSGHFLVEATEFLALALATDPYVTTEETAEEDLTYWKRRVVERCIYGVDKNPLAVELAKLSLWLATVAADRPLSFLDHHLKCGDSLIGARVEDLGWAPPPVLSKQAQKRVEQQKAGQMNMFEHVLSQKLPVVMGRILEITEQESRDYDTVRAKEAADQAVRELKEPFEAVADLWTSGYFGNEFEQGDYDEALGVIGQPEDLLGLEPVKRARAMAGERRFFHWELAFPEVFYDENGQPLGEQAGFDAVIGNPPYGAGFDDCEKGWLRGFHLVEYQFESYIAFVERALSLLAKDGRQSFIVPDSWLIIKFARGLRERLVKETVLERLVDLPQDVFGDAIVDSLIYVVQERLPDPGQETKITIFDHADAHPEFSSPLKRFTKLQSDLATDDNEYRLDLSPESLEQKIVRRNESHLISLGSLATVGLGCKPYQSGKGIPPQTDEVKKTKPFNSDQRDGSDYYPFYLGDGAQRYFTFWHGEWIEYGQHLAEPRNFSMFKGPRVIVQGIRNPSLERRLVAAYLDEAAITNDNLTTIQVSDSSYSLIYVLALINSEFMNWVYSQRRGTFTKITVDGLSALPIRRIDFTTPDDEREALVAEAKERAEQAIQSLANSGLVGSDAPMDQAVLAQAAAPALSFVEDRLSADPEQADVVHDLLAHLAERMIAMHEQKQERVESFWLDLEGVTDTDTFEELREHGKWGRSLWRASEDCRLFVGEESRSTRHLDESLGWNEDCFKVFVKELAGRVSNLSDVVGVYRRHHPPYRQLVQRIAASDRLIDLIVYRLYGLTDEEVAVVEK